ncbi:MAG: MFS transporter [Acidimicrobiales bacterium]|nr:MFS transporter [Acidimicrobiales bacterium]
MIADAGSSFTSADRRALTAVAAQFFINGAVVASFIPRLPELRDRLGIDLGDLGVLLAGAGLFGIASSATCGPLIERFGSRRVILAGGTVLVAMLPIIGVATHPAVLFLALAGLSFFDVQVDVAMNLQGSWLSARRPTPVMNRLHGLWSLGTVVGGLVVAPLAAQGVSLEVHLSSAAVVLLLVLFFVGRGLLRVDEHVEVAEASSSGPLRSRRLPLVLLFLGGVCALTVEISSSDWAAFRLADDFGAAAGFAGLGYVAHTVGMTIGRFGGDWVQDRLGGDGLLRLGLALATLGLAGTALVPNRTVVLAALVVAGLGIAPLFPRLYDDAAQLAARPGAGLGALTAGSRVASIAAPALVGALADTSLSVGSALALVTLPSIAGMAVVTAARR